MPAVKHGTTLALALLGAGLCVAAGCHRSGLRIVKPADAGRDSAPDAPLAADSSDAREVAPDLADADADAAWPVDTSDGREAAADLVRPDADATVPADTRDARDATVADVFSSDADATSRVDVSDGAVPDLAVRLDADASPGQEAGACVPQATPACVPGPSEAASLAVLDTLSIVELLPFGDRVVVGGYIYAPITERPRGRFALVSIPSGAVVTHEIADGFPTHAVVAGQAVAYRPAIPTPIPGGWQFSYPQVARWDVATGEESVLASPTGTTLPSFAALTGSSQGPVFWTVESGGDDGIAMWDPCSRQATVAATMRQIGPIYANASTLYWEGTEDSTTMTFASVPIGGGQVSRTTIAPADPAHERLLIGIDESGLYYTPFNPSAPGIMVMPATGGTGRTVVADALPGLRSLGFDQANVYWVDDSDRSSVRRAAKTGGPTEVVGSGPNRQIQAIGVDDCNVYWVVAGPLEVFYRRK
jgi:hypothetical protein